MIIKILDIFSTLALLVVIYSYGTICADVEERDYKVHLAVLLIGLCWVLIRFVRFWS